jgi:alkanesulfonate monooxygenase SsuD/methylene tetrahydromethanopterin reductase-like flavin-dependent oxidoreductase (luciferase family)
VRSCSGGASVDRDWPPVNVRHEMLDEALDIISELFGGEYVNYAGQHFRVDSAKLSDLPPSPSRRSCTFGCRQEVHDHRQGGGQAGRSGRVVQRGVTP